MRRGPLSPAEPFVALLHLVKQHLHHKEQAEGGHAPAQLKSFERSAGQAAGADVRAQVAASSS